MAKQSKRSGKSRSTGPRTAAGKTVAKMNALKHGLNSALTVIPGESAAAWEAYREGLLAAIAPESALEEELAEQAAALLWRRRRVLRYETAAVGGDLPTPVWDAGRPQPAAPLPRPAQVIQRHLDKVRDSVQEFVKGRDGFIRLLNDGDEEPLEGHLALYLLRVAHAATELGYQEGKAAYLDRIHLEVVGVPPEFYPEPHRWSGWTTGKVRSFIKAMARLDGVSAAELIRSGIEKTEDDIKAEQAKARPLEDELAALPPPAEAAIGRGLAFLSATVGQQVMRYENHLNRQLKETLLLLHALQAGRRRAVALREEEEDEEEQPEEMEVEARLLSG